MQLIIGVTVGWSTLQLAFSTVRFAGEVIDLQMGSRSLPFRPFSGLSPLIISRLFNVSLLLLLVSLDTRLLRLTCWSTLY